MKSLETWDFQIGKLIEKNLQSDRLPPVSPLRPKKVPHTAVMNVKEERLSSVVRRIQVLGSCLHSIFDSKLSDARKVI